MLRTFQSNPALGGFGSESTSVLLDNTNRGKVQTIDGDAFAQIIKELTDNAVDACHDVTNDTTSITNTQKILKRVRVIIDKYNVPVAKEKTDHHDDSDEDTENSEDELLRVVVMDNGIGMQDIQVCVDAFRTSKAHAAVSDTHNGSTQASQSQKQEGQTAGRYGLGLTLCLLHAQRLVPGSHSTIKSATAQHLHWTTILCLVDAEEDSIICERLVDLPKSVLDESGTSVTVLLPGGRAVEAAWPRLAEYFARYKLSLGLPCSLEVYAACLSRIPLCIRPPSQSQDEAGLTSVGQSNSQHTERTANEERDAWTDWLDESENEEGSTTTTGIVPSPSTNEDPDRVGIWKAAQSYLQRSFPLKNVAHTVVPIRTHNRAINHKDPHQPSMIVQMLVHGLDEQGELDPDEASDEDEDASTHHVTMVLVRMVNQVPLLDSSEAVACGLVHAVTAKKRVWNSFGLEVAKRSDPTNFAKLLTFEARDSDQVLPFFARGNHALLEGRQSDDGSDSENDDYGSARSEVDDVGNSATQTQASAGTKRRRQPARRRLLPAKARLGNILLIIQIRAQPTALPLPTLSKGRLPIDSKAIDDAFDVGITSCLRQLQKTNPDLLLTSLELRKAERDSRYVPAVAEALATIICRSASPFKGGMEKIMSWERRPHQASSSSSQQRISRGSINMEALGLKIENRLRQIVAEECTKPKDTEAHVVSETQSTVLDLSSREISMQNSNVSNDGSANTEDYESW